jgi:hypothetical protein
MQLAAMPSFIVQYVAASVPGQQAIPPLGAPAWQVVVQQMSPAFTVQAAGGLVVAGVQVPATHLPLAVLQTGVAELSAAHCESVVHGPQTFWVVGPHRGPAGLLAQSASVRQFPGVQVPERQR